MERYVLGVEGLSCTGCEETVSTAIERVDGVLRVEADHETGRVEITADEGTEDEARRAIHDDGYDVSA